MAKARLILEFLVARGWTRVGETEWRELAAAFPRITPATLTKVGIAVDQPFRGVEQHTFEELEASLVEMADIYKTRPELRVFSRKQVIAAKDRARWASRNLRAPEETRRRKAEMLEWMLVWLDDPAMFATWVQVRRNRMMADLETGVLSPEGDENQNPES